MRLPPLVRMYCPICGISATFDCTWRANSSSTFWRSARIGSKICDRASDDFSTRFTFKTLSRPEQGVEIRGGLAGQVRRRAPDASRPASRRRGRRRPARSACRGTAPARERDCRFRSGADPAAPRGPSRADRRPSETSESRPARRRSRARARRRRSAGVPVKQCRTPRSRPSPSSRRIATVSSSASRVWMTTGRSSSSAARICARKTACCTSRGE